jgi:hypothetical protein
MNALIERILALLRCDWPAGEGDEGYLRDAADFSDLQRRLQELEARSRPS